MNSYIVIFCVAVTYVSCSAIGYVAGPLPYAAVPVDGGAALKGPSASSTVVGPDGSSISASSDTGAVGVAPKAAVAAAPAWVAPEPVVPAVAYAAPLPPPAPVVPAVAPVVPPPVAPVVPAVAPAPVLPAVAPVVRSAAVLEGPSGRIVADGVHVAPAVFARAFW